MAVPRMVRVWRTIVASHLHAPTPPLPQVRRRGASGAIRNCCVALGEDGTLEAVLQDEQVGIRLWGLLLSADFAYECLLWWNLALIVLLRSKIERKVHCFCVALG